MKRLVIAVPVCAALGVKVYRWPYWWSVLSVVRSLVQPPPMKPETEGDYPA